MSWNSYPNQVYNSLLKRLNSNINKTKEQTVDDRKKFWLSLPYLGGKGDRLAKILFRKLNKCFNEYVKFIKCYKLADIDPFNTIVSKELHLHSAVTENTKIVDQIDNCAHLQYLESYYTKTMPPEINIGLKASKELQLFK